jgi:hypothetical protein
MAEFRETIPTITGPGAFLVSLIFLALILTSEDSRKLAFNWEFAVALVAISFPISIFITQVYPALFVKLGYQMKAKDWCEKYKNCEKDMHKLDVMVDYLAHKKCKGDKEWVIIQKRATAYNLFDMLRGISILFIFCYTLILIWYVFNYHYTVFRLGVGSIYGIALFCTALFWFSCKDIWNVWMLLDRKIINDEEISGDLDKWKEENLCKEEKKLCKLKAPKPETMKIVLLYNLICQKFDFIYQKIVRCTQNQILILIIVFVALVVSEYAYIEWISDRTTIEHIIKNKDIYNGENVTVEGVYNISLEMKGFLYDDQNFNISLTSPLPFEKQRIYRDGERYRVKGRVDINASLENGIALEPFEMIKIA